MIAVPVPIIVIVLPEIDATEVLSLAKLNEPVLLEDGSIILKGEAPYVLEVRAKFVIVGSLLYDRASMNPAPDKICCGSPVTVDLYNAVVEVPVTIGLVIVGSAVVA